MVQLTIRLTAASGRGHQLVEALHAVVRQVRGPGGCSDAHVAADVDEANVFWYCEDWEDVEALESNMTSGRFSQLLELMETSAQQPVLEFRVVSETRGLEYVTAVRERREQSQG